MYLTMDTYVLKSLTDFQYFTLNIEEAKYSHVDINRHLLCVIFKRFYGILYIVEKFELAFPKC